MNGHSSQAAKFDFQAAPDAVALHLQLSIASIALVVCFARNLKTSASVVWWFQDLIHMDSTENGMKWTYCKIVEVVLKCAWRGTC